jgi:hypothetical protein
MRIGPRGEKQLADLIGISACVMKIATGQEEDDRRDASVFNRSAQLAKLCRAVRAGRTIRDRGTKATGIDRRAS